MEIKTKYNVGEELYFIYSNKVTKASVISVTININEAEVITKYKIRFKTSSKNSFSSSIDKNVLELELFKTQEELLENIKLKE